MRLTTFLLIVALAQVSARGLGQKITLNEINAPVKKILQSIQSQSGYGFIYNVKDLDNRKVNIKVNDVSIDEAVKSLIKDLSLNYKIVRKDIVLTKIEPSLIDKAISLFQKPPIVVTGRVTDDKGQAMAGVGIRFKNGTAATSTDAKGNFRIGVPDSNGILIFTYLGFKTIEEPIRGRISFTVALLPDATSLDELVIVGYGSTKRRDLPGSVSEVNVEELQKAPVFSVEQALAGRVAGVNVTSNDGQPGQEGINIIIRGANSLTQDNSPLYVIDGFPMEDPENISLIPDDIKTFNILKDAAATAIYGARGANGVVVIETKRGKVGTPVITATATVGFQNVTKRMDVMSPFDFVNYHYERDAQITTDRYLTNGLTLEDYKRTSGINWQDKLFRQSLMQVYNISLRGGTEKTKYSVSGSVSDQGGVMINTAQNRYQGRFVLDQNISKKIDVGLNLNYSRFGNNGQIASSANAGTGASSYLMYSVWGYRPISGRSLNPDDFDEEFDDGLEDDFMDEDIDETMDYRVNPILTAENELRKSVSSNIIANAFLTYNIVPGLKLRMSGGFESRIRKNMSFYNSLTSKGTPLFPNNTRGQFGSVDYREKSSWLNENILTWTKKIGERNRMEVLGGFTMQGANAEGYGFLSQNVPNESLGIPGLEQGIPGSTNSSATENTLASFLGRVNYHYQSKYILSVSFRADGSSKFAPKNRWGYFPSAGLTWRIKDENFMKPLKFISEAKLRTSYGVTGNNRVSDFDRLPQLTNPLGASYSFNNGSPMTGAIQSSLGNEDLKWESTTQTDIGIDLGFLKNRILFTADIYRKTTSDLLLNADIPTTTGFTRVYKNIGEIRNDGLELTLTTVNVKSRRFTWSSDFNISFNRNKVMGLSENQGNMLSTVSWDSGFTNEPLYIAALNGPAAAFFGYLSDGLYQVDDFDVSASGTYSLKLSRPTNGMARYRVQPGDIRYKDINLDGVVDVQDRVVIGRVLPKHSGGFNNNFSYKRFDLNVFFQWSYGNQIYNANRMMFEGNVTNKRDLNQFASYNDRWTFENQDSKIFRAGGAGQVGYYSDYYLESGSYLRLKTVALSYAIPTKVLQSIVVKSLSVSVSAQNLYTWTNYSGMDPEVSVRNSALTPGFDYSAYPRANTLVFGIRAGF
ncbi:TonB-dependent receptor [Pedobacter heparinus]|uniref:TonB-dependent receptor n=1 Tax=Pedobacter heparinus TaxID=984 RepID=UPI00292FA70F|nr:TonB-dependent receptor [Pedobacter heparinus]